MKDFVKQLRSGNYLQGNPISIPKLGLFSNGVTQITAYGIHMLEEGIGMENYSRIDVTGEVLEKCGFDKCLRHGLNAYQILFGKDTNASGLFILIDVDDFSVRVGQLNDFSHRFGKYEYLDQLQNLVFSISGKELIYTP